MRRLWLSASVCMMVVGVLSPGLAQDAMTRFKIDSHYHFRDDPNFIEKTVEVYRKYNTMVCALAYIHDLDAVKAAVDKYPDVFIRFGRINLDDPAALDQVDQFYEAGFKGIGELTRPLRDFNDPAYFPIYERIQLYGMYALFHTGIVARQNPEIPQSSGMAKMRPAFLDEIARRFPKLTIQGAHLGNPWYTEAAEAARWNPNLYFDMTGSSLLKKASEPEFWGRVLWWRPALATLHSPSAGDHAFGKIVFGTDEGPDGLALNIERFEKFLEANDVPESVRQQCWAGTMMRILGIEKW